MNTPGPPGPEQLRTVVQGTQGQRGWPGQSPCVCGATGMPDHPLPRPESQGPSKSKFPLHPFNLPTPICLWGHLTPGYHLSHLEPGPPAASPAPARYAWLMSNQQGLPNTQDEAASWGESTKALTTLLCSGLASILPCQPHPGRASGQLPKHAVLSRPAHGSWVPSAQWAQALP